MHLIVVEGTSYDDESVTSVNTTYEVERFKEVLQNLNKIWMHTKSGPVWRGYEWYNSQYTLDEDSDEDNSEKKYYSTMYKNILSEEDINWFDSFMPQNEMGICSIDAVKIYTVTDAEVIL